jgi:ABC-2 type transport system ATP-binding protein
LDLRKLYKETVAVDRLSFTVDEGEVFGFLGPNGAGKTTTVKMLLGLVRPSGGSARVLGDSPGSIAALGRIGFLPEHFRFPPWFDAGEFLDFSGSLCGMPAGERRARVPQVLELVGLSEHAGRRLGQFSKGMAQRIGLAQALLNHPRLVFLDEPTSGLDPIGRLEFMEIIRSLRRDGVAVFLNSHLLGEVEATCDRVAVIKAGRLARQGTLAELTGPDLEVEISAEGITPELKESLGRFGVLAGEDHGTLRVLLHDREALPELVAALVHGGARVFGVMPRKPSLEELFVRIMEETP